MGGFSVLRKISRDVFARFDIVRENVLVTNETCRWCGQVKQTPKGKKYLFRYGCWDDQKHLPEWDLKLLFCSISCWRSYYV